MHDKFIIAFVSNLFYHLLACIMQKAIVQPQCYCIAPIAIIFILADLMHFDQTHSQLKQKYKDDFEFHKQMDSANNKFDEMIHRFSDLDLENMRDNPLEKFVSKNNEIVYFYYGIHQPEDKRVMGYHLITNLHPKEGKYSFVYFNKGSPASHFVDFKTFFLSLPIEFFQNLDRFYLVNPSFYHKAINYITFGIINKYFGSRFVILDSCLKVCERFDIPPKQFVDFVPEEIAQQLPFKKTKLALVEHRVNFQGQNLSQQAKRVKNTFQQCITAIISKDVLCIQNYEQGDLGIPLVLQLLIYYFKTKPQGLECEGIFRKSVSVDEQNQTHAELSKRNFDYLQEVKNPHIIASLIKRFFAHLKVPVIPFDAFEQIVHDQGVTDKKAMIKWIVDQLPQVNYLSLMYLIEFLKEDVIPKEPKSRMNANNLAICFTPCLMRSQKPSMADLINTSKAVAATNIMINDFDYVFGDKAKRNSKLRASYIGKKKEDEKLLNQWFDLEVKEVLTMGMEKVSQSEQKKEAQIQKYQEQNQKQGQDSQKLAETKQTQNQHENNPAEDRDSLMYSGVSNRHSRDASHVFHSILSFKEDSQLKPNQENSGLKQTDSYFIDEKNTKNAKKSQVFFEFQDEIQSQNTNKIQTSEIKVKTANKNPRIQSQEQD